MAAISGAMEVHTDRQTARLLDVEESSLQCYPS